MVFKFTPASRDWLADTINYLQKSENKIDSPGELFDIIESIEEMVNSVLQKQDNKLGSGENNVAHSE